ncbi:fibronectin type III domain-containing protein [Winogradskyella sp.]|uniref:fibronectin type III domain-containing protein n=1 Tax=Winogradskyella sp. TaxID=1883156 RepID=UPI0025FFE0B1|nr:fibronectin type III domain-containing protein [Winogradskyella sp.]
MKKVTLFLLLLCFSFSLSAQVLNQPAAWPNTNWTVTGTYNVDPGAFEADPTLTTNFAFDDDDAGAGSDDDIAAESPIIDLSAAFTAGETWLFLDVDYTYNDLDDTLNLEYWDADSSTWVTWQQFVASADQPFDNFCNGGRDAFTSNQLNIAGFTATQLSGFQYRISFLDDGGAGGAAYEWGFCFDAPTITSQTPPTCPDPDMLTVANVMEISADLQWTETGSATLWDIEWGTAGFTLGTGTTISGLTTTTYSLTGLTAGTSYDFYVLSDCGGSGTSNLIGPFNFVTATPGGTCAAAFAMTVEADCDTATPTTFDFSIAEDLQANGETASCDGFGDFGYWVSFTAPAVGSVTFNFGGAANGIGLEVLDACGGATIGTCENNTFDAGESSDIIGGLTPGNTYVAVIWSDVQNGTADVCIEEGPSCTFPIDLTATVVTLDGADLGWTENGTATTWNVEVVPNGDVPTGTPTTTGVSNPYTVTGLMASTSYDFYVQADCGGGDTSDFSGPFTFTTLCDVFVPDYIENFTTIIPNCWNEADSGDATTGPGDLGAGSWNADEFLNIGAGDGAYSINLWLAAKSDWLLSPQFDLTGGPFQVEFDFGIMQFGSSTTAGTLGSDDIVQLLITTDNGATWTPLLTYDSTSVVDAAGEHPVVDLTAYGGMTVQFGILGSEGAVDDAADNEVFVDNFRVRGIPTCAEPADLAATNLSLTSTEVSWTEAGTATSWNIEYGPTGFALGTGTVEADVTTNPFVLTGLNPDTDYEFYVQAICDPTNLSSFAGPGSFFTGYCESMPTIDGNGVLNTTIGITDFPTLGDVTYENHTSTIVNVFQEIQTDFEVLYGHQFTYDTNIWIDFNDDLIFDDTEVIYQGNSPGGNNPHLLAGAFTLPITAPIGEHRMRISGADFNQVVPDPCYNGTFGVTLDFTVNIQALTCTIPEADFTVVPDCGSDQFFIDVNVISLGDANSLELSNNVDTNTVQAMATGTYQVGPFPFPTTVKVFVTNEQDNNCVISSDTFEVLACPPANDECIDAIVAFVNPDQECDTVNPGTILAATSSSVPTGSCGGSPDDDVWFEFTAIGEQQIIAIQNIAGGTFNLDHALYEGTCGSLTEVYCSDDDASLTPALIVGNTYYVRVFSAGVNAETSTFDLCISTFNPTFCYDALPICADPDIQYTSIVSEDVAPPFLDYDCLGSQPDPQWNTIVFDDAGDYVFTLEQTDAGGAPLDIDFMVWGPFVDQESSCAQLLTENIVDCSFSPTFSETITLTGVPANSTYIILITNFSQVAGTYTFTQDSGPPDGTNCSVVCDVVLELEGGVVDDDVEDLATPDEIFNYCGFDSVLLEASTFYDVDEVVWYMDGFAIPDYDMPTLTVTESGTYQAQVLGGICDQTELYFSALVEINFYDDTDSIDPQNITLCDGPGSDGVEDFDLDALSTSLGLGTDFTITYYTNITDANQAQNAVASLYNSAGETLIMRVEDTDAANDNYLGCRQLVDVELVVNPRPLANQPANFIVCDDTDGNVDGTTEFDLASINDEVSTVADIEITYHTSQDDANNDAGALTTTYSSSGEAIFIRVEDTVTGCYETTSFNLEVNILPLATFDPQYDYEVCPNATVPVEIGIIPSNFTVDQVSIQWFLDNVLIPGESGLLLSSVLEAGEYSALIEFNDSTITCNAPINTTVIELPTCVIPQGISPNGDMYNQTFDLSSYGVTKLEIFNRNGTLVYSKTNYTNEWEGQTNDGKELPVGTYFYTMEYEGGTKTRSAWIYINK